MSNYDQMSDAELDAEVARAVMAWDVHARNTAFYVDADKTATVAADIRASKAGWQPTRKPEHSRRVLDAMVERGAYMDINGEVGSRWTVAIRTKDPVRWNVVKHESLDRAICIAAIMALEAEGE